MTITIDSDIDKLQINHIQIMLSKSYWCPDITANEIMKGIRNSTLVVGAYDDDGAQVGFLRVLSDKVRSAYMFDVIVKDTHRGNGIGQNMVNFALSHPEMKDVYHWFLITKDAHGLYEKSGFKPLGNPEFWMELRYPRPDRSDFQLE